MDEIAIATRKHFSDIRISIINDVKKGALKVDDPCGLIKYNEDASRKILRGDYDHTFTHLQHAEFLKTGVTLPLLPSKKSHGNN